MAVFPSLSCFQQSSLKRSASYSGAEEKARCFPFKTYTFEVATARNENCLDVRKWLKETGYPVLGYLHMQPSSTQWKS